MKKEIENGMVLRTVNITSEQQKWLEEHSEVNLSGFVRKKLANHIKYVSKHKEE